MGSYYYEVETKEEDGKKITEITINQFSILQIMDSMTAMLDGKDFVELKSGNTVVRFKMYYKI